MESTFRLSGDSPLTGELGVERMKQRKLEHGEHAADTHTSDRLQLHGSPNLTTPMVGNGLS